MKIGWTRILFANAFKYFNQLADAHNVGGLPKRDFAFRMQLTREQHLSLKFFNVEVVGQVDGQRFQGSLILG